MGEIFMFCKKCGFQCNDGAVFCQKCGTPLETQQQPVQQPVQPPVQQPFAYNEPAQQPVQQQDYNAPVQQPMQPQGYGMPAQQPVQQPYYGMPAKQPMSKGVLAAIIGSAVAIVALIVVLLVVLLGDSGSGGGGGRSDDDEPSVTTSKTDKTSKTEKTNKTNKENNSGDPEDIADAFAEAMINGDADSVFDLLHEDTIDYVVDYAGYSSRRDMVSDLDEQWTDDITEMEDYGINLRFDYSVGRSESVDYEFEEIAEYYDEEFGLNVDSAVLIEVELIVEMDYGDGWEEDSSYFDLYILEIDGDWYLDAVETIPQVW